MSRDRDRRRPWADRDIIIIIITIINSFSVEKNREQFQGAQVPHQQQPQPRRSRWAIQQVPAKVEVVVDCGTSSASGSGRRQHPRAYRVRFNARWRAVFAIRAVASRTWNPGLVIWKMPFVFERWRKLECTSSWTFDDLQSWIGSTPPLFAIYWAWTNSWCSVHNEPTRSGQVPACRKTGSDQAQPTAPAAVTFGERWPSYKHHVSSLAYHYLTAAESSLTIATRLQHNTRTVQKRAAYASIIIFQGSSVCINHASSDVSALALINVIKW